jgi:hypothetical protein
VLVEFDGALEVRTPETKKPGVAMECAGPEA